MYIINTEMQRNWKIITDKFFYSVNITWRTSLENLTSLSNMKRKPLHYVRFFKENKKKTSRNYETKEVFYIHFPFDEVGKSVHSKPK